MSIYGRTDLASEAHSLWAQGAEETGGLSGVTAARETLFGHGVTVSKSLTSAGRRRSESRAENTTRSSSPPASSARRRAFRTPPPR